MANDATGTLGAAVVGTGFGCLTHLRALRAAGFRVEALVGRNFLRTTERAKRFGVPRACTTLEDALALPEVDAVTVATPPFAHAPVVHAAVAAGKHVLCEKPFARDATEARALLDAATAAGVVHLLGTEFRFATAQALSARAIAEGAIGEPRLVTLMLHVPMLAHRSAEVPDWWSDRGQGGGWLGAHGSHLIDQVRHTLGEFEGVSASLQHVSEKDWSAEDTYTVHFRLVTGVAGVLQSSASLWGRFMACTQIAGSRGTLWLEGDEVWVADEGGARRLPVPEDLALGAPEPPPSDGMTTAYDMMHMTGIDFPPYVRLCERFRDLILGRPIPKDPAPATFADGVAGMEVIDAIRDSSDERRWVAVGGR
ncbi:MAG TPA: Gfo/Idh/MocA family oxidoreductase [Candidatus Binatia bacterium]|nr:Gfo/Idh/MocA family oxidoreductase [Candidatus Binatia bacterium]